MQRTIEVLHLYPDLANLYGDRGNLQILKNYFAEQGFDFRVDAFEVQDEFPDQAYDFYYMGPATESKLMVIAEDIQRIKEPFVSVIEEGAHGLFTGNALEVLGRSVHHKGKRVQGLGLFNFESQPLDRRFSNESILKDAEGREILGYQNQAHQIFGDTSKTWFPEKIKGLGLQEGGEGEGLAYKNLRASYLLGPLLARNYFLAEDLVETLIQDKGETYKAVAHPLDSEAYDHFKEVLHTEQTVH